MDDNCYIEVKGKNVICFKISIGPMTPEEVAAWFEKNNFEKGNYSETWFTKSSVNLKYPGSQKDQVKHKLSAIVINPIAPQKVHVVP